MVRWSEGFGLRGLVDVIDQQLGNDRRQFKVLSSAGKQPELSGSATKKKL